MNLQSLVGNLRKKHLTAARRKARRAPRLHIESLEAREVPAVIPPPVVDQTSFRNLTGGGVTDADMWALAMKADPTNPNQLFGAYVTHGGNGTRIGIRFSTNGGATWAAPLQFPDPILGGVNPWIPTDADPKHTPPPIVPFEQVSDPNVAWDSFGNVFLTYTEYHTDNTAGNVVLKKFSFTGAPTLTSTRFVYSWFDSTQAYNPNVAVDTNRGSYDDPDVVGASGRQEDDLAAAQTSAATTRVFVTWNTNVVDASNAVPPNINPNAILMRYSSDGGATFSGSILVNDDGYSVTGGPYVFSKTVFTPGRAGETDSGGRMVTTFSSNSGGPNNRPTIKTDSRSFNTTTVPNAPPVLVQLNGQTGPIADAIDGQNPDIDTPVTTVFNIDASNVNLTRLDHVSLLLQISHQALADLSARLVAPNGASVQLFLNRTSVTGGDLSPQGLTGGTPPGLSSDFTDAAFWRINQLAAPYAGDVRPETGQSFEATFSSANPATFKGIWRLEVTDNRNSNTGSVTGVTLRLGQSIRQFVGPDRGTNSLTAAVANAANFTGTGHPTTSPAQPGAGIGPNPVLAVDNTLGAFSPYQNRVYLAYTGGGRVWLMYADQLDAQGGLLWNTTPINAGAGYLPQLTVDPATGTLVLAYYTTKYDAAGVRSTMVMQTAVNGADFRDRLGTIELSPATYVTPEEQTYDQIRSKVLSVEPIPSNGAVATDARGWGNSFGLASFDGRVNLVYPGNLNTDILEDGTTSVQNQLRTQNIRITTGPRVVGGDMGPILGTAQVRDDFSQTGTVQYNGPAAADGRNQFTAFVVTFDRVIDPSSFTPADIKVIFRGPSDDPTGAGTPIGVASVRPLDDLRDPIDNSPYGSKRFLVTLTTPQTAVGTYSYLIGANVDGGRAQIRDRVRGPVLTYIPTGSTTANGAGGQIVDFTGTTTPLVRTVTVGAGALPAGSVVGDVNVTINISHTDVANLRLELISPAGKVITLAAPGDANIGADYQNTTFDDQAPATNTLGSQFPPYTNLSIRPTQQLAELFAAGFAGTWTLRVTDEVAGDSGVLQSWSLTIGGVRAQPSVSNNNFMDQDADGVENEPAAVSGNDIQSPDGFTNPDPTGPLVFQLPYQVASLPIVIPGPRLVQTFVVGQYVPAVGAPANVDNLVKDGTVSSIDVRFDRTINSATFTASDVLRIIGPLGDVPLTGITVTPITALGGTTKTGNSDTFRITFPQQKLSGTYTVQLSSQIADTDGNLLDTSTNAGVGNLLGTATGADVAPVPYGGPLGTPVAIPAHATVSANLNVSDAYQIKRALVHLKITHSATRDLEGRLVAPDGTTVLLFLDAPKTGDDSAGFQDTTFDDAATTPVQEGGGGFVNISVNPIESLFNKLVLDPHTSRGVWKLQISNKGDVTGTIDSFGLTFDKPQVGTGLGEEVADQTQVSFRISQTDGGTTTAKGNWTPIGPAPEFQQAGDLTATQQNNHRQDTASSTSGRIGAIAVDPSDPSGNTVYAAGASGGVWRTTNFFTHDVDGPTWVPLTDFGPTNAINVGSLAVFNSTGDPNRTVVIVGTGSDDLNNMAKNEFRQDYGDPNGAGTQEHRYDGVGFLISENAGKTWDVLDSTNNFDPTTNVYRPFADAGRDHLFVGAVVNKLVVEPLADVGSHRPIIYAAVGAGGLTGAAADAAAGLWRSRNGGRTWVKIPIDDNGAPVTGDVSDFLFGEGSAIPNSLGRPTYGYVAVKGSGVYFTSNLNEDQPSFALMAGGVGRPTVNLGAVATGASETPNGNFGKIALATPALTTSPLANNYYQRWLYAAVANTDGTFRGLYMTKDRGLNWTKVKLTQSSGATAAGFNAFGFSDVPTAALPEFDPTMFDTSNPLQNPYGRGWAGGNFSLSLAVDPNDPNIVYLGSDAVMKIDTTLIRDPYNLSLYSHSDEEDAGAVRKGTVGGATEIGPPQFIDGSGGGLVASDFSFNPPLASTTPSATNYQTALTAGTRRMKWNQINLDRDPYNQFGSNTSLRVTNTAQFNNNGGDTRWVIPGGSLAEGDFDFDWVGQVLTIRDPLTGEARVIVGHDEGITTYVAQASGATEQVVGITQDYQTQGDPNLHNDLQITAKRNGNLQAARLYSGDVQPTMLATDIANALTYAAARRRLDIQRSQKDPLGTGDDNWKSDGLVSTISARANYVQVAQNFNTTTKTVDKTVYILRRINDMSPLAADPAGSRKTDFFQVSVNGGVPFSRTNGLFQNDTTDPTGFGQWDNTVRVFAVNPIDQDAIIMGSAVGRFFRTVDQGRNWNPRGEPGTFDGSYLTALAFGAPRQAPGVGLSDFFYAGSTNGNIFVTFTGGGNLANSWFKLAGPGANGTLDGSAIMKIVPNPIRGSRELFAVTKNGVFHGTYDIVFDNNNLPTGVTNLVWEDVTTNLKTITAAAFNNPNWVAPVLATKDPLLTLAVDWRPTYGQTESHPILYVGGDGGVFRAIANADQTAWVRYTGPANGSSSDGGGLPLVKVTDLDLALGMIDPNTGKVSPAGSPDALIATTLGRGMWSIGLDVPEGFSGPKVIDATPNTPQFQPISEVRINFDMYITPSSFTRDDVTITRPDGTTVDKSLITVREDLSTPPPGQQDFHTDWFIDFPAFNSDGTYTIKIGPDVRSGNAPMNQDGVLPNGQASDAFVMKVVIGLNDLADFVNDTYQKLLGRSPSTTEYGGTNVVNMDKARLAALGVVVKELLSTYNSSEARQRLVERLFKNGGAAGEIGNLLPSYTLPQAERDFYVNALKNGTRSPESIIIDIIATTDATKGFNQQYFAVKSNGTPLTFLNNVYADLYKVSGVQFGWLPVTTRNNQLTQANTPSGRLTLVRSLVNGAVVTYTDPADGLTKKTDFRSEEVKLAYQQILNRAPTAAEVTAGKSLIAKPLAINSIQGSEWLYWKLLSSQEFFSSQVQNETPAMPDNGLHTDRSWVEGVIAERYFRTQVGGQFSTDAERDTFSQKVLDRFKLQRAAFVNAIVLGTEYRDLKITGYFQMVHGRNPTDTERAAAQTALRNGSVFPGLISGRFASAEFYSTNAPVFVGAQPSTDTWARAVVMRLFGVADPGSSDPRVVGLKTRAGANSSVSTRTTAASWLLNSNTYRDKLIGDMFALLLGRAPTANELLAYENFLKTHRWEALITDILANGAASATVTAGLPRAFWEEAN